MTKAEIRYCTECASKNITHQFQDETYGKFMRVHSVNEKTGTKGCSVCGYGRKSKK